MGKEKKIPKVLHLLCTTTCADCRQRFEAGVIYDIPANHPCLKFFEPVIQTTDPAQLGPAGVELKKGGKK